jgi:putative ABC transport system permease protein
MVLATRVLRNHSGFSIAVVLTLALGIGGNTAVFGLVRAVVLSTLPYADSESLYSALEIHSSGRPRVPSYPTFLDWQEQADVFDGLAFARGAPLAYQTEDETGLLLGAFITDEFFDLLGVPAELGRVLTDPDFDPGAPGALVLSHRAWRNWFGSDPDIIGRTIVVDELPLVAVGVMPAFFAYPDWGEDNDLWIAMNQMPAGELTALNQRGFSADSRILVRVRPDLSIGQVEVRMGAIAAALASSYPEANAGWNRVQIQSLKELEVRGVRSRLFMLWGAVVLVFLICCLNLANLYLVHGASRRHEYAIRSALGASRARLFGQILGETLVLAVLGGVSGLVLAWLGVAWAKGALPDLPRIGELSINAPVLGFAAALSVGTALLFALIAAKNIGGSALRPGLSGGGARTTWTTGLLSWVQSAQIGVTFVLLVGAWLLGSSLLRLSQVDPGYDPSGLVLAQIQPPSPTYDEESAAVNLYASLVDAIGQLPGVSEVGLTNHGPSGRAGGPTAAAINGLPDGSDEDLSVLYRTVSAGYFRALGMTVVAGREFTPEDLNGPEGPLLVNETLARRWGERTPVGSALGVRKAASSRADFGEPLMGRVVGVVADVDPSETGGLPVPIVYVPYTHSPWGHARLFARVGDTSIEMLRAIEGAVRDVEPAIPLSGPFVSLRRVEEIRAAGRSDERLNASLVSAFAVVALLLALVGIYGVVAYTVALRTRTIGIRLALGASPRRVVTGVMRQVAKMTGIGLLTGGLTAVVLSRFAPSFLFDVSPLQASAYAFAGVLLSVLAIVAGYLPARRAGALDPARVLRAD